MEPRQEDRQPIKAQLVLCYPRLLHRFDSSTAKQGVSARMRNWLPGSVSDFDAVEEINIEDVESAAYGEDSLCFVISYRIPERGRQRCFSLQYSAESPTECALIVAHIQYLMELAAS
jgi:hypothetical protein